ncbi:MAG: DUF2508 family protein [Oscillospiraceae bacterium]|nr:DUF2508 family protein [Oscillospiraceae bacterium]
MAFGFFGRRKAPTAAEQARRALEDDIRDAWEDIQGAYCAFDQVTDPDLIEAWNFEINARQARYNYLLRQWKRLTEPQAAEGAGA